MAYPASFDESNDFLGKPSDMTDEECVSLSICRTEYANGLPVLISCWKLTQEELEEINKTGRVWLTVVGQAMPPVVIDGTSPFSKNEN